MYTCLTYVHVCEVPGLLHLVYSLTNPVAILITCGQGNHIQVIDYEEKLQL
jgi:hypothetical protein